MAEPCQNSIVVKDVVRGDLGLSQCLGEIGNHDVSKREKARTVAS